MATAPARTTPRLVTIIRRLTNLEDRAFLTQAEGHELNRLRRELADGWPEVSGALAAAYLGAASGAPTDLAP